MFCHVTYDIGTKQIVVFLIKIFYMLSMSCELVLNSFFGALEHIMHVFRCYHVASHANVSRNERTKPKKHI